MAHILIMPRQGNTVESCIIVEWKKNEGDVVDTETIVCEVETDKATFEVPAGSAGTVLKILYAEGDDVPVLEPIMVIGNPDEKWENLIKVSSPVKTQKEESIPEAKIVEQVQPVSPVPDTAHSSGTHIAISPRARAAAFKEAVDIRPIRGTGAQGRIIEADILRAAAERPLLTVAAKDALRSGEAIPAAGSGIGGRITLEDIRAFAEDSAAVLSDPEQIYSTTCTGSKNPDDEFTDIPIKGIRKLIADKMMTSLTTTAQFTLNAGAEAVRLQALRERFKTSDPAMGLSRISVNDLILFLTSRLLKDFPFLNGIKTNGIIRRYKNVHLGMAVDSPRGLMVPVIRNADKLSLAEISAQAKTFAEECQNGSIKPAFLSGSTFTVTNLGNTGIESFTPVINTPEIAILGVCGIRPKAVSNGQGGYDILPHLPFSLTVDHAAVDGLPAAKFLKALCSALKDIDVWIAK